MSERRFLSPLPHPELYASFYQNYEESIVERQNEYNKSVGAPSVKWNAWNDVMKHALGTVGQRKRDFMMFSELSQSLGPQNDVSMNLRIQRVFGHGLTQQQRIIDTMYKGRIQLEDIYEVTLDTINPSHGRILTFDDYEEMHNYIKDRIVDMGRTGLQALGYAYSYVHRWAEEVYTPATYQHQFFQNVFEMGHGVAVYGARKTHENINTSVMESMNARRQFGNAGSDIDSQSTGDTE